MNNNNIIKPASVETAWEEAEQHVFALLCAATKSAPAVNAFVGQNAGVIDAWGFDFDSTDDGAHLLVPRTGKLNLPAHVEGWFSERVLAMRWAMQVLDALPAQGFGNVECLRVSDRGMSAIALDEKYLYGADDTVPVYTLTVFLDCVFIMR